MAAPGKLLSVCNVLLFVGYCSAYLELEEFVEWKFHRTLYDYMTYGAVTFERIDVPHHSVVANFISSVEASDSSCPLRNVKVYANQFGIPVVSRDKEMFPKKVFVNQAPVLNVSLVSNNQTVVWQMDHLHPGQLFLMAVMPRQDTSIKQQGLHEECDYYMTTRVSLLYYRDKDIQEVGSDRSQNVTVSQGSLTLLSFRLPVDVKSYTLNVLGCMISQCLVNVSIWESLTINMERAGGDCIWTNGTCRLEVTSPAVDRLSYLSLSAEVNVSLTIQIEVMCCDENTTTGLYSYSSKHSLLSCITVGELGRETPKEEDSSNYNDHFVTWDHNLSPHSMVKLTALDTAAMVARFRLRTSDTGTSLRVYLHMSAEKSHSLAHVFLCLSVNRIHYPRQCLTGATLNVTSLREKNKDQVTVPYPQSGLWFISIESQCFHVDQNTSHEVPVPCKSAPVVNLTIRLAPCMDGGCGLYGACKVYMDANLLYSACNCFSGWRGYGCNDGSEALSETEEKLAVYLLTLSNLFFIPAIGISIYRKFYIEALVYSYNMFFSTFYHACDTSQIYQLCILPYNTLSFADFFASLLSFWVTLIAMARVPQGARSFLQILSTLFISIGEVYNRHGLVEQLLPIAAGVLIVLVSWGIESYKRKTIFPSKRRLLMMILPGILLSCVGLVINVTFQTESNYKYVHCVWHLLETTCILFLLPPRRDKSGSRRSANLSIQSGDINRQSLLDSREFEANINHADDALGTSVRSTTPLESASPPDTPVNNHDRGFKLLSRNRARRQDQNLVL